ncbi:penicillin binding protein PBP4B [Butyrivibrio sp. XPD2006]|uniref:penicillin binding protein PBP4B n=1 Tax=Butyrivibrio sp. XPD2006 TaxID=1280668 RepID=UPI000412816A|nr:penicillin binding protein PBP4B [Butyrivibrio sp. XPD2006]
MSHKRLMAATMAIILAAVTSACGAEVKEPVQPIIETVEKETVEEPAQDTATDIETGQQTDQTKQGQQDQENSAGQKSDETNIPSGPLKPELVAGAAPKLPIRISFPDWKGYTDNTLAMNSMYSFYGYHGQGELFLTISGRVESFDMFVNGTPVDTSEVTSLGDWKVDISSVTKNGENTVQVSNIVPSNEKEAVIVSIPYPEVISGTPEEEGIHSEALQLISDLIETDIENGFTSAQLSVVRNGRLIYENAWGKTNTYQPNGLPNTESPNVTTDTLYDLASVTKMFSVNYALQKLVTDGEVDLDDKITKYLGDEFVTETIQVTVDGKGDPKDPATIIDLDTIKKWKSELTVRELLKHQGGFPADPKYCAPKLYKNGLAPGEDYPENPLFAGNVPGEETKQVTVDMIRRTPLDYEPGTKTVYSDADYMILGLVVEKVTGQDLDTYLKKTFYEPMGLTHITYNPLRNGFSKDDCAATELNGNTRDGLLHFDGYRTETIQGEVHDEKAFYSMDGISGHAGLFSNATDLAKLASVMLTGGYGENSFFSQNVMDMFTSPKEEDAANWGLGWWRQGENQRVWYFGTQSGSDTFGHQGWTGTIVMIDPDRDLIIAYLTNKKNSRVTSTKADANKFDGDWYTSATLGFVPEIMSIGMDTDVDISAQLKSLTQDMAVEAKKLLPKGVSIDSNHPAAKSARSKQQLAELYK